MKSRRASLGPLRGRLEVPGDKSISHRALILAGLAEGVSRIENLNPGDDVGATATVLARLGVSVELDEAKTSAKVEGYGWEELREPDTVIDAGNSGTTLRLGAAIAAGVEGMTVLTGDDTLLRRPMLRVVAPLRQMGASIDGRAFGEFPPLVVRGGPLQGIDHVSPVASAQVKTALLLAGTRAKGTTSVQEPSLSRDHTERMLAGLGVPIQVEGTTAAVSGPVAIPAADRRVPGDVSSALFLIVAAVLIEGSDLEVTGVGLNPTRTAALDLLASMGADLEVTEEGIDGGEPYGTVRVRHSDLQGIDVPPEAVPRLIDEVPILAIAATQADGRTTFSGVRELRVKESDRIASLAEGMARLGVDIDASDDGFTIQGPAGFSGGEVESWGDHRIAMSFAVAGLIASGRVTVANWSCVNTSFPGFLDAIGSARGKRR